MVASVFSFDEIWERENIVHKIWASNFYCMNITLNAFKHETTITELEEEYYTPPPPHNLS